MDSSNVWVAVLAAGDGKRVRAFTLDHDGMSIPKQFWRFDGRRSLLRAALQRAQKLVPAARLVPVVAEQHRLWWERELRSLPRENVLVQPVNRGTAAGILLPVLHIFRSDPDARILVLPTDHAVRDEKALARALKSAVEALAKEPQCLLLLGITPDSADPEYGWILPAPTETNRLDAVQAFVEKPSPAAARGLLEGGALWNSFMFAATARTLLEMFAAYEPALLGAFLDVLADAPALSVELMRGLYELVPVRDFSRDVLQRSTPRLRVLAVPACGWLDVGTPARLTTWQRRQKAGNQPRLDMAEPHRAVA